MKCRGVSLIASAALVAGCGSAPRPTTPLAPTPIARISRHVIVTGADIHRPTLGSIGIHWTANQASVSVEATDAATVRASIGSVHWLLHRQVTRTNEYGHWSGINRNPLLQTLTKTPSYPVVIRACNSRGCRQQLFSN